VILRLEDAYLFELPGLLKEFFADHKGRIILPEGSLVLFSSLSHLANRGVESYADEVVKSNRVISSMLGHTTMVAHSIFVPLGGICSSGLIRMMLDVDAWLQSGDTRSPYCLSRTRDIFWRTVLGEGEGSDLGNTGDRIYFLPENTNSPKKIRFISHAMSVALPKKIPQLSTGTEGKIIGSLLSEINDTFGFSLDTDPQLSRKNVAVCEKSLKRRYVVIGAKHTKRIAGGLVAKGHSVCDLSVPGWKADTTSVSQVCAKLSTVSLTDSDVVIFDPLSNSAFCGTDDEGAPKTISKDHTGKYHCEGHLSTITSQMCSIKLRLCDPIIEVIKKSHVILLSPIPRYITTRCCGDKSHLQNFESRSLPREITNGLEMICELLQGWGEDKN
jgi:hypothetical protein